MVELLKYPSEEQVNEVMKQRNLTDHSLQENIDSLKDWLLKQPHLPDSCDERMLRKYLLACKSIERAKEKLIRFYEAKATLPEFITDRDPLDISYMSSNPLGLHFCLPELAADGSRVYFFGQLPGKQVFNYQDDVKGVSMLGEVQMLLDHPAVISCTAIYDCTNADWEFLKYMDPVTVHRVNSTIQSCFVYRVKAIILFNVNPLAVKIVNICKRFIKEKFQERMFVYSGDHTCLKEHLDITALPSDYGGKAPSCQELNDAWQKKIIEHRSWIMTEGRKAADLTKKPEIASYDKDLLGIQGSFRTLDID